MSPAGILVVADDEVIASGVVRVLDSQGYMLRRLPQDAPPVAAATPGVGLVILDLADDADVRASTPAGPARTRPCPPAAHGGGQ